MFLDHQLTKVELYPFRRLNRDEPIAVPIGRVSSWRARRADRSISIRQGSAADGFDAVPVESESVVRDAAVRVEPEVQGIVGGYDASVCLRQSVAAESAHHLAACVSSIVNLRNIIDSSVLIH